MQVTVTKQNSIARVALAGRFDFSAHREFKDAYQPLLGDAEVKEIQVDFGGVDYLDSSALGMLLVLRERGSGAGKLVALVNCQGVVLQVLEIANFKRLFTLK